MPGLKPLGAAAALALLVILAGCSSTSSDDAKGGGDTGSVKVSSDAEPYVEALVAGMHAGELAGDQIALAEDAKECVASRVVDVIGVDRFEDVGVTPDDLRSQDGVLDFEAFELTEDEGNDIYDSFGACGTDLGDYLVESMTAGAQMSAEVQSCIAEVFDEGRLRTFMVTSMIKGDAAAETDPEIAPIMEGLTACTFLGLADD